MKILAIGNFFKHEDFVDCRSFKSSVSLLDYDTVLLDLNTILGEYKDHSSGKFQGYKCLDDHDSVQLVNDIQRRKFEILEILKLGRTIIVYTPTRQVCYVDTGKREHSGTGRNQKTTRIVNAVDLTEILPNKINTVEATGSSIDFLGDSSFSELWRKYQKTMQYNAYFKDNVGKPIFKIKGTNKVVGCSLEIEKGHILFVPTYYNDEDDEESEFEYFQTIKQLVENLKKETGDYQLPDWSNDYILPEEAKYGKELAKYEHELQRIMQKISTQKEMLLKIREHKILFTGTGKALEVQVSKVFEELGFSVAEGLPGRDDLILKHNDKLAVVEVKGVTKSAAEKHAAQLEKWVSEYYSANGTQPKGLLVVNTFKDTPLKERTEDDFPSQMIGYCERRNHCLITGIQLLAIYLYIMNKPEKKEEVIEVMFNTSGILNFVDWTTILDYEQEKQNKIS